METEIRQILEEVENYSSQKSGSMVKTSRLLGYTGWGSIIAASALLVAMYCKSPFYVTVSGAIFLILNVLFIISNVIDVWVSHHKPLNGYAAAAESRINTRILLIHSLVTYSNSAKQAAVAHMERDVQSLRGKISLLIGAFDKVGITPAVLALYFAASKLLPSIESLLSKDAESVQTLGLGVGLVAPLCFWRVLLDSILVFFGLIERLIRLSLAFNV